MARDGAKHTGVQETQAFQRKYCHKLHMWLCLMGGNVSIAIDLPVWCCSQGDDTVTVTEMTVSCAAPAAPSSSHYHEDTLPTYQDPLSHLCTRRSSPACIAF